MKVLVTRTLSVFAVLFLFLGLAGCNTMEGFGEDMKELGEKIEKKAGQSSDSSDD